MLSGLCFLALTALLAAGCGGKDDDPKPSAKKINMKFTVTVAGVEGDDYVYFQFDAGNHDASQYGKPMWKINGVTQGNETTVKLGDDDFRGNVKTYVVESATAFDFGSLSVDYTNYTAPLTVSYKAEINGEVKENVQNRVVPAGGKEDKTFKYSGQ